MSLDEQPTTGEPPRFEFRFKWNAVEHRLFYRAVLREVRRRSKGYRVLQIWFSELRRWIAGKLHGRFA